MKKQTPETQILRTICEYLELKGYWFFRINNIPVYDPVGKRFRAMPKYSIKGVSDILVLHKGQSLFIEVKVGKTATTKKTYQSKDQKEFQKKVEENGCMYLVVRNLEDLSNIL